MLALSLAFLLVWVFSAYAYGATVLLAFRQVPVWGPGSTSQRAGFDRVTLAICFVSTIWFVLNAYLEFRLLVDGLHRDSLAELFMLTLSYTYPPLIMHTVLHESAAGCTVVNPNWRRAVGLVYAASLITGGYIVAAVLNVVPRPQPLGTWIGTSITLLFSICSVYCIALLSRHKPPTESPRSRPGLRRVMIGLFLIMIPIFIAGVALQQRVLMVEALDRFSRTLPLLFLIASVYFESRFEFYDLIVKRAATLLVNLLVIGAYLAVALPAVDRLPAGPARPWLFAIALLPLAMVLTWSHVRLGQILDRMWFGRDFTPVEAVKQVLSAMQPATTERALVEATEARLSEMFRTPVRLVLEGETPPEDAGVEMTIASASPVSGAPLRVAVLRGLDSRTLLSEDLALLRSLASVFGYMLENVRLHQRRQEQDLVARELRLQTSRSELKALRAQINPHFLFNALNAIASLIHTDPARADAAVEQLAEVFRYTLRRSEQEWAPLDQELAFAQAYLDVEQARFGRRLSFTVAASPAAGAQVPAMLLQTLVENAVKHGISQVRGAGRIEVHARVDGDALVLEVTDSGPGPLAGSARRTTEGESFGLRSVRDRLRGHFGERASLELQRDEARGVTIARISMPLVTESVREGTLVREPA